LIFIFFFSAFLFAVGSSLQEWNFIGSPTFVGLENYQRALRDPIFLKTVVNSLTLLLLTVLLQAGVGFLLALLVSAPVRLRSFYRTLFFIPSVLSPVVLAFVFRQLFAPDGEMTAFMQSVGLGALWRPWLADPDTALWAMVGMVVWAGVGTPFLLYSAGLTQLEPEILDAARAEGANSAQLVRHIIFPLLRNTHVTIAVIDVALAVNLFDLVFLSTAGGPARATEVFGTLLYKTAIVQFQGGYASAVSIIVLIGALATTALILVAQRRKAGSV
jgi:ABC-type sugar transport system permease subunit